MSEASESKHSQLVEELQDKATRDAFVSSQMSIPLAFQIQALREQQGLTQKQLAEKAGMLQPRIAAMERPSGSEPNLRTLKRLASAFDVALIVRFAPFSELVEWAENFSPDTFVVPSFDDDPGFQENVASSDKIQMSMTKVQNTINMTKTLLRMYKGKTSATLRSDNLEFDFSEAMPQSNEVSSRVKMTATNRQGGVKYDGRVGAERKSAA